MADYRAVAAVCDAVVRLLSINYPASLFDGTELEFKLYTTADLSTPMQTGVSLFLYRIAPNKGLRNPPGRAGRDGKSRKPALPLDLHFLVTIWARDAALQQAIAGWAMRCLEDHPVLTPALLNAAWPSTFPPDETVEILLDDLPVQDLTSLWDRLPGQQLHLSIPYIARAVPIDPNEASRDEKVVPVG
ncbi:MAG: hypothetical protein K0R39_1675 [Symbiobacteriaceae bacterium]|nr:hypothetical protein [Symbiobacteriaceae bacterium]